MKTRPGHTALFTSEHLTHYFGGLRAVHDFSLEILPRELVGLIGPNGAGKTTIFNLISGIYKPTGGNLLFLNFDITGLPPFAIARLGIARTFQNIRLFGAMSVIDTVKVAAQAHVDYGLMQAFLHTGTFKQAEIRLDNYCYQLLKIFNLHKAADAASSGLPYAMQRRLEIVRALAAAPKLLLLDEPAAGMNPQEARQLIETIRRVRNEFDLAILIIEHNMQVIMAISDRIVVVDF
ncbi:MAG: ATP-binding cassette domain-containing protein, partial [Chitinivibrionales bacterium]|nr:ATP-binding cassette domain-containing protein [Chitinivibrionales bacterium]